MAINASPQHYFLDILSQWPTAIPIESQWFVVFDLASVGVLASNISEIVRKLDSGSTDANSWSIRPSIVSNLIQPQYQNMYQNQIGCVFARQITIPSDYVTAGNEGLDYSGYQGAATTSGRRNYEKLQVIFHETNSSFLDFVIRPWIIAVGYYGLIARSEPSKKVKCNSVYAIYMGKGGAFKPSVRRKVISFKNAAPVSIQSMQSNYGADSLQTAAVDFVFDSYSVMSF